MTQEERDTNKQEWEARFHNFQDSGLTQQQWCENTGNGQPRLPVFNEKIFAITVFSLKRENYAEKTFTRRSLRFLRFLLLRSFLPKN